MKQKLNRLKKVKTILRQQSFAVSISEIHEALTSRCGEVVSRKTIERDLLELSDWQEVEILPGMPQRFRLLKNEIEVALTGNEIRELLAHLPESSSVKDKLRAALN